MSSGSTSPQPPSLGANPTEPTSNCPADRVSASGWPHAGAQALADVNSTDLLRGQKAVHIQHNGSTYRLQATRLGKLILTK